MFSFVLLSFTFHLRVFLLSSEGEGTRGGQLLFYFHCVYMQVVPFLLAASVRACPGVCVQSHLVSVGSHVGSAVLLSGPCLDVPR